MTSNLRDELHELALALIDVRRPAYALRSEVLAIKAIFENASGQSFENTDLAAGETNTSYGTAISPRMAALCVDDFARTVQFIRGLHAAIVNAKKVSRRLVRVLYTGCGPWATLATPLMTVFTADEVIFTLLDLHSESLDCVRRLVERLGLTDRIEALVQADAANYRIDQHRAPDILVIEMLRAALESEPQVAVTRHLSEQAPSAVLVPQEIRIDVALVNASREFSLGDEAETVRDRVVLGPAFVLNSSTLSSAQQAIDIPEFDGSRYSLMLLTTVHVYGSNYLRDYDSGITLPKALASDLKAGPGDRVIFEYEVGEHPKLNARVTEINCTLKHPRSTAPDA
jgi:hypothetical protein